MQDIEEVYRQYASMVYRRCLAMLRSEEEAIDAVQEVFVSLMGLGDEPVRSYASLLYCMATRHCLNRIRSRRRRPEEPYDPLLHEVAQLPDAPGKSHTRGLLRRLFGAAPESSRVIATLHFVDGLTLEETAQEVGMSVSGVRKRIRTMRRQLRNLEATS